VDWYERLAPASASFAESLTSVVGPALATARSARASASAWFACESFRLFWATDWEDDVWALTSCWRAWVTCSNAAALSVPVRPPLSLARRAFAARRFAWATARSSCALLVSAVARVSPALTICPGLTATVSTIHEDAPAVPVPAPAPEEDVEFVATDGALPKAKS
jgi:hypothetical protein